ncbi:MAG TPA: DNA-formamidopyrimidine glycosylase family protein [Longimicrobiales bacterium]|nr:DNA-formamidopyrimidine glycosylase family protein [Longimicrobiales bacterium]
MPELPEIHLYIHALEQRILGKRIEKLRVASISLLKTFDPPASIVNGMTVRAIRRLGKRIVLDLDDDVHIVIHLMIAGRFQWKDRGIDIPRKLGHAAFDFADGTLLLTEAGTKKRASMHIVRGEDDVAKQGRGGVEPLEISLTEFSIALRRENRTLKRALTDPRIFSGIGNAHSDEILFLAKLSPAQLTRNLGDDEIERLYAATRESLRECIGILIHETGDRFPSKVTAFHPRMRVHGKYNEPCVVCGSPIQRIVYASNETNYCATCQTGGRLLADRAFSRLLKEDWPRTLEELEEK